MQILFFRGTPFCTGLCKFEMSKISRLNELRIWSSQYNHTLKWFLKKHSFFLLHQICFFKFHQFSIFKSHFSSSIGTFSVLSIYWISEQDVISQQGGQNFFIYYMRREYRVGQIYFMKNEIRVGKKLQNS